MKTFLACLLLATAALVWPVHVLIIEDARKDGIVWCRLIRPEDRFVMTYRHSVELCQVRDYFHIDGERRLVLDETVFPSSNTGLPAVLGEGERIVRKDNGFRISNMRRVLPALEVWVDRRYDNALTFGGQSIALPELAGDTLLRIQTKKILLAECLFRLGASK